MIRKRTPIYGLLAEFVGPQELLAGIRAARAAGYKRMDAYTPFPVEGLHEEIGHHSTRLPLIVLVGGLLGCFTGFFMQWYSNVIQYPMNIAGKPDNSWPAFIPVTFECTVLFAAFAAVFGMLALNGLPMPYHPLFNVPSFELASRNHFFLCVEAIDPQFDREKTKAFLRSLNPRDVAEVEH